MTYFVSECLVLLQIDEEMLLKLFQIFLLDFGYVLFNIREWVCDILFTPHSGVEKHVENSLFLNQHFVCFVLDSIGDCASLCVVDSIGWWLPVVLQRRPVGVADKHATGVCCLHCVSQQCCHIEIFGHLKDMAEILVGRCCHSERHFCLADLLKDELENVFNIFKSQRVADNLPKKNRRHVTKENSMLAHQSHVQNLVYLVVRTPLIAHNVICDCFNKLVMVVLSHPFFLQIWVPVCAYSFRVIEFHMDLVCPNHVESDQVHDSLLPCVRSSKV